MPRSNSMFGRLMKLVGVSDDSDAGGVHKLGADELVQTIREVRRPFDYRLWTIGQTDDLIARRNEIGTPDFWQAWPVESAEVADKVCRFFGAKRMHRDRRDPGQATYVYVYMKQRATEETLGGDSTIIE